MSITEAAFQSGFSSLSHFNTTFRAQIGCSPSVYRKARMQVL
ncbi:MAG TPA: AraC family transcriptional regulator [Candidatus Gallacutalibacter pullistercoris]|nr:AraC family transcriptional regulator [Candidatus Gallacutalibacter pullistercoris]